jgi:hypothetical protein
LSSHKKTRLTPGFNQKVSQLASLTLAATGVFAMATGERNAGR